MPLILQSVGVIGVFGLNAFVIFCSCVLYAIFSKIQDKKVILKKMISDNKHYEGATYVNYVSENDRLLSYTSLKLPVTLLCIWAFCFVAMLVYGSVSLRKNHDYKTLTVAAIQHNDNPDENGFENYREGVQQLINLTNEALEINPDIDFVVWPETAVVPSVVYNYAQKDNSERKKLISYLLNYIQNSDSVFVIGNQHIEVNTIGEKSIYNSALVFEPQKNVIPPNPHIYSKIHLVPFSENFPYEKYFPHIYKTLLEREKFFWNEGKEINVFNIRDLSFYTPICFEDTFPDLCRKAYQNGARCFFSLTNDSWSKSESCQYQHLAMAKFRAVENAVPVVISAVSGQTAIIDMHGNISAMANPFSKSYVIAPVQIVPADQKSTIYNKIGDVFGYGIAFLLICVLIIRFFIVIMGHIHLWQSTQK